MTNSTTRLALRMTAGALALSVLSISASAQAAATKPADKMDHGKMAQDHGKSPWKELDAYHQFMMDTWHPAKENGDMAPLKAKAADMAKAAKTWADSKPPKGCDAPKLTEAVKKVNTGTAELAGLVAKGAPDAELKKKLAALHETFEVVEGGCSGEQGHK